MSMLAYFIIAGFILTGAVGSYFRVARTRFYGRFNPVLSEVFPIREMKTVNPFPSLGKIRQPIQDGKITDQSIISDFRHLVLVKRTMFIASLFLVILAIWGSAA